MSARPSIPPPKLGGGEPGERRPQQRRGLDALTLVAMVLFVGVGGLLVFGFARALVPAAKAQLGAACRSLAPEPLTGEAPELDLEDLDGNPVSLADFRGKFLIVNFWATWCEPCTREWPDLDRLADRLADRDDIVIVAVGVNEERGEIGPYLERMGLTETKVRVVWAKGNEAHRVFGSEKLPDTYFVGRDGELRSVFVNARQWGRAGAVRCVEDAARRG